LVGFEILVYWQLLVVSEGSCKKYISYEKKEDKVQMSTTKSTDIGADSPIFVAGHRGLAGSAIVRRLKQAGYSNIVTRSRQQLDLTNQAAVQDFMLTLRPSYIFLAAAKVGGINANNSLPADFIYQNLAIESNVIHAAHLANVNKLLFLGSSCIYPRDCPQPMSESHLLTGPLEKTSEPYGVAKIAGLCLCESYNRQYGRKYISVMPTNLYGPNDNFDLDNSHVLPALIRKIHEAKKNNQTQVTIWGTGTPYREFLHADDMADGCLFLMEKGVDQGIYNLGTGVEVSISKLANVIKDVIKLDCEFVYDDRYPDGTPRKLCDVSKMNALGWQAKIELEDGIRSTYNWYVSQTRIRTDHSTIAP